jgi:hypothetical protein
MATWGSSSSGAEGPGGAPSTTSSSTTSTSTATDDAAMDDDCDVIALPPPPQQSAHNTMMTSASDADHQLAQLQQQLSCMGTTDKDVLVAQLQKIIGPSLNPYAAQFFLDMNNWLAFFSFPWQRKAIHFVHYSIHFSMATNWVEIYWLQLFPHSNWV